MKKCVNGNCPKGNDLQPLENFNKNKSNGDGYQTMCRICQNKSNSNYRKNHKNEVKAYRYKRYHTSKSKERDYKKEYRRANPHRTLMEMSRRGHALIERTPKWLSEEQIKEMEEIYRLPKELQWLSDPTDPLTVDHIIPLQGKNISGLHVPWNLRIIPRSFNSRKRNITS